MAKIAGTTADPWSYLGSFNVHRLFFGQTISCFGETAILHSFDLLTTRMQAKGDYKFSALKTEMKGLYSDGGIRSFYRGFGFTSAIHVPIEMIYRLTYDYNCRELGRHPFFAGLFADTLTCFLQVPSDVVTQRIQIAPRGTTAMHIISSVYRTHGLRGFYPTLNIALVAQPILSGIWWALYERGKAFSGGSVAIGSVAASITCAILFNPVQVIKTRLQTGQSFQQIRQVLSSTVGRTGLFTAGLVPAATRAALEGYLHAQSYETVFYYSKGH